MTGGGPTGAGADGGRTARAEALTPTVMPSGISRARTRTVMVVSSGPHEQASTSAPFDAATAPARSAGAPRPPGTSGSAPPLGSSGPPGWGVTAASAARSAAVCARALADARAPTSAVTSAATSRKPHRASPITDTEPRCAAGRPASGSPP